MLIFNPPLKLKESEISEKYSDCIRVFRFISSDIEKLPDGTPFVKDSNMELIAIAKMNEAEEQKILDYYDKTWGKVNQVSVAWPFVTEDGVIIDG